MLSACATAIPEDGPEKSDELWLTIGVDAVDTVNAAFDEGILEGAVVEDGAIKRDDGADQQAAVVRIRRDQVGALTRIMHDQFHRCGGFVVHSSFKQAVKALDDQRAADTKHKLFAGYTIDNGAVVQALIADLQEPNIASTITTLSSFTNRYYTTQTGVDAAHWIHDLWQSYSQGRGDVTVELFQHAGYPQPSVILTITGDTFPDEVVVLGAHLDSTAGFAPGPSTRAPGADDDASGVATLSEVLRVAMASGFKPDRTVKFMAYAAEEVGLRGSGEIAGAHQSQGIDVIGVMQLDMTNYNGSNQDIALVNDYTNAAQNGFIGDLIDTYLGLSWAFTTCGYGCSDHASWHNRGFPASLPFEALFSDYNPAIHSSSDTLAFSGGDALHALKFARLAAAYLAELAKGALDGDVGGGPPPEPPPAPKTESFSGSLSRNQEHAFGPFPVAVGSTFSAEITGTGDADLYTRIGTPPTRTSYDCRPYKSGSSETCNVTVPAGQSQGYVMIRGYTAATYNLTVSYFPPD